MTNHFQQPFQQGNNQTGFWFDWMISRILLKSKEKTYGTPGGFKKYLRKFLIRRTIRIFPVYYLIIALLFIFNVPPVRDKLPWLALYGTNIYIALHKTWLGSVDHLWSLAVDKCGSWPGSLTSPMVF